MLVARGIPDWAIAFVHEAKDDSAKAALLEELRTGRKAVVLGSTKKLGTGANYQDRALADHHVDGPWTTDGVTQRKGRTHRPGNQFSDVMHFTYVIERTFDSFVWQTLLRKAKMIAQFCAGIFTTDGSRS